MWGNRGKQMQLTAGLIGLKTSFFSSGFLGALSWRCDGEPSDLDDAACAKTPKGKQNKTGIHQESKIHFLIPLWSEEQRWEGYQSSAWEQDTSFTGSSLHFPRKTTQKNIAKLWSLQVQLTSDWSQTKLSTTVNQCGCKYCLICTRDWVCRWLKLPSLTEARSRKACIGIQRALSQTHP